MKIRLLIVDDEKDFTDSLAERLEFRDFDVSKAYSGEEAVGMVKEYNYDVVILDVAMPGMDGVQTLREIKNLKPLTEVIMLTGHATVETAIEGMKLGAYDYLLKPTEIDDLVTKVQAAYSRKAEQEDRIRKAKMMRYFESPRAVLEDKEDP
ncbi:MAG: response regulator [Deltaproteobacteria bacterium]|nr:response regulator [Deltaproteobacteria bacterium]MBW2067635.1 response regulator [Deltaproteobacteria bacterium]